MHLIDRHAYTNRLRPIDPAQKGGVALTTLLFCLLLNRPAVGVLALIWMATLTIGWAGIEPRVVAQVLVSEGLFLALTVLGVALGVSLAPPAAAWRWQIGPLWLASSPAALWLAFGLMTRALGCAAAMTFLALTTPLVDLIELLRRLRVPELLIDLMTVVYRSIFLLLESLSRMATAQDSRLGYRGWRRGMVSAGMLGSRIFIDAYQRSQRMSMALDSRGYAGGALQVLPLAYRRDPRAPWLAAGIAASLLLAWGLV